MKKHKCISVFSGAGLMDEGLRQAGLEADVCYELDADACESARLNNFPAEQAWFGTTRPPEYSRGQYKSVPSLTKLPRADVVWGGPPCQSFSMAANPSKSGYKGRREVNCEKGQRLLDLVSAGSAARAKIILIENVPQILKFLDVVAAEAPGYELIPVRFNALSWLPQSRSRVFLIIVRNRLARKVKDALEALPMPGHCDTTLRDHIGHLKNLVDGDEVVDPTNPQVKIMKYLKPGGNWTDVPAAVIRKNGLPCLRQCPGCKHMFRRNINHEPNCPSCGKKRNRRSTHYIRLLWNGPSRVLTTEPTSSSTFQTHPDGKRLLSVFEHMALQGLPDNYRLVGHVRSKLKQLGNGVPVPAAKWIGEVILRALS